MKHLKAFNDGGRIWIVAIVPTGGRYGRNNCLTNDGAPMVEFYDPTAEFDPLGQFVSRYYLTTLLESTTCPSGLCLDGGVPGWVISSAGMARVLAWLRQISDKIEATVQTATIPIDVLSHLIEMSDSHIQDIDSGIAEGLYLSQENPTLEQKRAAAEAATALLERARQGRGGKETFTGHLSLEGITAQVDFQAPINATTAEKDLAFFNALAQQAQINYVSIGKEPS